MVATFIFFDINLSSMNLEQMEVGSAPTPNIGSTWVNILSLQEVITDVWYICFI